MLQLDDENVTLLTKKVSFWCAKKHKQFSFCGLTKTRGGISYVLYHLVLFRGDFPRKGLHLAKWKNRTE